MKETTFTPGPWKVSHLRNGHVIDSDSERHNHIAITDESSEHDSANARLIVAAPELYAALDRLVRLHNCEMEGLASGQPTVDKRVEAVDNAASVLLLVEGE